MHQLPIVPFATGEWAPSAVHGYVQKIPKRSVVIHGPDREWKWWDKKRFTLQSCNILHLTCSRWSYCVLRLLASFTVLRSSSISVSARCSLDPRESRSWAIEPRSCFSCSMTSWSILEICYSGPTPFCSMLQQSGAFQQYVGHDTARYVKRISILQHQHHHRRQRTHDDTHTTKNIGLPILNSRNFPSFSPLSALLPTL